MLKKLFLNQSIIYFVISMCLICIYSTKINAQITDLDKEEKKITHIIKCQQECGDDIFLKELSPHLSDRFGIINYEEEMAKIDGFLQGLNSLPNYTGFIVAYGGKINKRGEVDERIKRIKDYMEMRKFTSNRIKFVYGGFREKFEIELWNSRIPNAFPPLSPTISLENVIFKGKMKPLCDNELLPCN